MVNKNITRITWSTLAVSNCKLLYVCTSTYIIEYCKYACVDIDIVAIPEVRHSRGLLPLAVAVRVSPDVGAWLGPHILVAVLEAVGPAHDDSEAGARTGLEPGELPGVLVRGVAGDLTPGAGGGSIGLHLKVYFVRWKSCSIYWITVSTTISTISSEWSTNTHVITCHYPLRNLKL